MKISNLLGAAFLMVGTVGAVLVFAGFGEVVSSFRMPPITNYCEGLAWDGEYLWSCGSPTVYFVRLTTNGSFVSSFRNAGGEYGYSEGATWDGAHLWYTSHVPGYDVVVSCVTTTGSSVSGFRNDVTRTAGLAWENDRIMV